MKRLWFLAVFIVSAALSRACCITYDATAVNLASETAIIVWDQDAKVEHFIRAALFKGKADDFGFIFPSPSEPFAIEIANSEAFHLLEQFKPREPNAMKGALEKVADTATGGVSVLSQKVVGDFQATVLKASDGTAIGDWLKKNGHKMRPAMEPWLDHYAKKNWYFTAFKYLGQVADKPTEAVRVSFRTDRSHYPYKMPSDTWPAGHHRNLDLYVVTQGPVRGAYADAKPWQTPESWRAKINPTKKNELADLLGVDGKILELPENLTVTRFENVPEASNYDQDLTFEPVPEPPYLVLYLALGALATAGYAFYRKSRLPPDAFNSNVK